MDIKRYAVEETRVLCLLDSSDAPMMGEDEKPMTITLFGPGSKTYARAQALNQGRLMEKLKAKGSIAQSADEKARDQAEFLASITKEFSPNIKYNDLAGEALYKAVYSDISIGFIAEQASKFAGEWSNFTRGSAKS